MKTLGPRNNRTRIAENEGQYRTNKITPRGIRFTTRGDNRATWPQVVSDLKEQFRQARVRYYSSLRSHGKPTNTMSYQMLATQWRNEELATETLFGVQRRVQKITATARRLLEDVAQEGVIEISLFPPIFKRFGVSQAETTFTAQLEDLPQDITDSNTDILATPKSLYKSRKTPIDSLINYSGCERDLERLA